MNRPGTGTPAAVALAAAAIAAQIAYPLTDGRARDLVTVLVVVLLAAAALTHAASTRGLRWAGLLLLATAGIGLASEIVGTATGIPYGCYSYASDRLGPTIAGVPLVVPFAWTAGFYPVWCVASRIARSRSAGAALTVVGVVGWDLYLDAQMVADGQWWWCVTDAGLPGIDHIPLTNYLGWVVVATVMVLVMEAVDSNVGPRTSATPARDTVPVVLFLWTWLGSALAHSVFLDPPELLYSAVYGLAVMGVLGIPLLRQILPRRTNER
ncbi:MAG: carotenoid biosynthesis protein [Rhodococcus sp.]|nr:carotenoid biosynthesis protein [Rhodococcus sp. (in: high G+C Gram-positive bacteria)]